MTKDVSSREQGRVLRYNVLGKGPDQIRVFVDYERTVATGIDPAKVEISWSSLGPVDVATAKAFIEGLRCAIEDAETEAKRLGL